MATDIIARGMITEYKAGTNINFTENRDGTVEISASGSISSEDSVARDAINNHKSDTSNPHNVTPAQIGLGNVDNTSDLDKPISTAVQKAIDNKADKTVATTSADGLMSAEDKTKLDSVGDTYALKSIYGDTTINVGRKANTTVGEFSTAEGYNVTASGNGSHAEGQNTTASEDCSHAEGRNTTASGMCSHAGGTGTKALHENEVAYGKYNESKDDTVFSVGDGTADDARHNAFEITKTGGKLHDKEISTTPIKSTIISGTTNENGDIYFCRKDEGITPIFACGNADNVFTPFLSGDGIEYMLHVINAYSDSPVANTAVTATVYYF